MWTETQIKDHLKATLKDKRYSHSILVAETAVKLAEVYGGDVEKAKLAGLVHDCAKYMGKSELFKWTKKTVFEIDEICENNTQLLHGAAGAAYAKEVFGIEDNEVLSSVMYHTTGKAEMSLLEKIIYIADYVEPSRVFPGVEDIRELVLKDLDGAILKALDKTIAFVISKGELLHGLTVECRNNLILNTK